MASDDEHPMLSGARELVGHEVLVVDNDDQMQRRLVQVLAPEGLHLTALADPAKALDLVAAKFFGVVIIDVDTPAEDAGLALVEAVRQRSPESAVLLLIARPTFAGAVEAFRRGASDVIEKSQDVYLKERVLAAAGTARRRGGRGELLSRTRDTLEELLRLLMAAERRAAELDEKLAGRNPDAERPDDDVHVLCVDGDDRLFKGMRQQNVPGFSFVYAQSGGEALDRATNLKFQIALIGPAVQDLPSDMVVRALRSASPELITITYVPGGPLTIVESTKSITLADSFTRAAQLVDRLEELSEAHRARARERRYLQAFRERHYDLLRRLAELRQRLEKA